MSNRFKKLDAEVGVLEQAARAAYRSQRKVMAKRREKTAAEGGMVKGRQLEDEVAAACAGALARHGTFGLLRMVIVAAEELAKQPDYGRAKVLWAVAFNLVNAV